MKTKAISRRTRFACTFLFCLAFSAKPVSSAAILTGCTPASLASGTFKVPTGWTLVTTQDFESTAVAPSQGTLGGAFESKFSHSGKSAFFRLQNVGDEMFGIVVSGKFINSRDVYLSWYEYEDPQARLNLQLILARRVLNDSHGYCLVDNLINWEDGYQCFNQCLDGVMSYYSQGIQGYPNFSRYGKQYPFPVGKWVQYEVHFRSNDPNSSNGMMEIYQDGQLLQGIYDQDMNGSGDMSLADIHIGEANEVFSWYTDAALTQCSPRDVITPYGVPNNTWNTCPCPAQCPSIGAGYASGTIPTWNRYIDDIVVIKPSGGPDAMLLPPTGLSAVAGNSSVKLSWTAVAGAASYIIKHFVSGTGYVKDGTATGTSYTINGVINGTTYYYVVTAVNGFGESNPSKSISVSPSAAGIDFQVTAPSFSTLSVSAEFGKDHMVDFRGLPGNSRIEIFSISGNLIKTASTGESSLAVKLGENSKVGSYIYRVRDDAGHKACGKIVIVK